MTFLIMITCIPMAFALEEYAPSMPSMVNKLGTTTPFIQASIPLYMFAGGISVLFWGPLADRFGRRIIMLTSIPVFFVGSVATILAPNITLLLFGRVLQGIGLGACGFLGSAIMSDVFEGSSLNRVMSLCSATYSVVPIIAPAIGGLLQQFYGWRANFSFILFFIFLIYILFTFGLVETHSPTEEHKLHFKQIFKNYLIIINNSNFLLAALCMISIWSSTVAFSLLAPFLLQDRFGISALDYGLFALLTGLGYTLGSILSSILVKHIRPDTLIKGGISLGLVMMSCLLIFSFLGIINLWTIILITFFAFLGTSFVYPNTAAIAIAANPSVAGTAMGFLAALLVFGISITTFCLTFLNPTSTFTLSGTFLVLLIFCRITYHFIDKEKAFGNSEER